ncbi:MAG TPA: glycosyltransferase family 87 protein [Candidatus Cloacimonadota bacterium]|nr:glycosyltransferase family 87 protein [Candidatus Cloacimonadota bacterium]
MKKNETDLLLKILLIFAVFFAVAAFMQDMANTMNFSGMDLRNRIVGARLVANGYNPYFYKWNEGDSDFFLDPRDDPTLPMNRVTVPPTVLQINSLFSNLPYKFIRIFWTLIQWLLLLGTIYLFSRTAADQVQSKLIWIVCLFFVADSYIFRLHIERGQIYILYVFLFALSYFIYSRKFRLNIIIGGLIAGYCASLRFPVLLLILPFIFAKRWKFVMSQICGFILGILASSLYAGKMAWISYFKAMQYHGLTHLEKIGLSTEEYPQINIEGIKDFSIFAELPISDSSLQGMMHSIGIQLSSGVLLTIFCVLLVIITIFFLKINKRYKTTGFLFLFGSAIIIISEVFLPAARYNYNDVIIMIPLSLLILDSKNLLKIYFR